MTETGAVGAAGTMTTMSTIPSTDGRPRVQPPARAEKAAERVARALLESMAEFDLQAGDSLPHETLMIEQQGVGRATLREALRLLEVNGLITIRPGPRGGPVVGDVSSQNFGRMATMYFQRQRATLGELLEARLSIEPLMARMAAEREDKSSFEELHRALAAARELAPDDPSYGRVMRMFHDAMNRLSGNPILDLFANALADIYLSRVSGALYDTGQERARIMSVHEDIAKAVLAGDGKKAERLTRSHMAEFADSAAQRYPGLMNEVITWA